MSKKASLPKDSQVTAAKTKELREQLRSMYLDGVVKRFPFFADPTARRALADVVDEVMLETQISIKRRTTDEILAGLFDFMQHDLASLDNQVLPDEVLKTLKENPARMVDMISGYTAKTYEQILTIVDDIGSEGKTPTMDGYSSKEAEESHFAFTSTVRGQA